jgi:thiol-disulfide isomerase/thioredoxin
MNASGAGWRAAAAMSVMATGTLASDTVRLTYLPSGAMPKIGGYMPQRVELSAEKPAGVSKAPEAESALFGVLQLGPAESPRSVALMVVEPAGGPSRLFVDSNGNGDLTDDEAAEWNPREVGRADPKYTMWMGGATVEIPADGGGTMPGHFGMYRFDPNDPDRAQLKNTLLYYSDYAYEGEVKVGEASYKAMVTDDLAKGDFRGGSGESSGVRLLIDVNANGRFDSRGEAYDIRKPFNIKGETFEVTGMSASGAEFQVGRSTQTVAEILPPPDLAPGNKALAFKAETTAGALVNFPSTYEGKVVMLDFWATWCGPCIGEIPNMVEAYEKYHGKGFEILAISLDRKGDGEKLKQFTEEHSMPWPQVFDGGFWQAEVAQQYGIDSIPRAFLVDGDTGEILAGGDEIRGENLGPAVEAALAKKGKK